jgi:SSS family solute:Na+ symporter
MLTVGWTGFCVKPLRDSGVVTIAELFEKKFGARIRWWSGVVIVLGGLLTWECSCTGGSFLSGVRPVYRKSGNHDAVLLVSVAAYDRGRHVVRAGHRLCSSS